MPEIFLLKYMNLNNSQKYTALLRHKAEALHHHGAPLLCAIMVQHAWR